MRHVDFTPGNGRRIARYGSDFVQARLAHRDELHVSCMYLEPGGRVGRHPASVQQLFAVVQGEGWAAGDDGTRVTLRAGDAVLWEAGERHEAGTDTGLTAIVVESAALDA
ncbi:MAG TPA: cupin domain-containing protein [Thermomicrobiaceae bacterium]|nr:cupin domain-containing protein [Thermomicrobiaceae bacterium]